MAERIEDKISLFVKEQFPAFYAEDADFLAGNILNISKNLKIIKISNNVNTVFIIKIFS